MPPDEWKEEHDDRFDCLAKDASLRWDRRTALAVGSLRERCSVGVGRNPKRSGRLSDANGA